MATKPNSPATEVDALASFEQEIARQEEIVYGTALFYECVSLLHINQKGIVETYRKQFRNIIQKGRDMIARASALLAEARNDAEKATLVPQFRFTPCRGHADPPKMAQRAKALAATYNRIFPDRDRSTTFSKEEILKLIEEASSTLE